MIPSLPTFDDAVALAEKENDDFYVCVFVIRAWLGELVLQALSAYAENKIPRDRLLQTGQAWCRLSFLFRNASEKYWVAMLSALIRYSRQTEDEIAAFLSQAVTSFSVEQELSSAANGPDSAPRDSITLPLHQSLLQRLCDWLDAVVHLSVHELWHLAPVCFDPDPERRDLAILGVGQRDLAQSTNLAQTTWHALFSQSILRFRDSPKWPTLGEAMCSQSDKVWTYREVDTLIISLWPLLKKHNWTYRDLLNVLRDLKSPLQLSGHVTRLSSLRWAYPLEREQAFATYCINVLGLRKTAKGKTAKNGRPPGYHLAMRLVIAKS